MDHKIKGEEKRRAGQNDIMGVSKGNGDKRAAREVK